MRNEDGEIDLDKVVWDAPYRRQVIERLNREATRGDTATNLSADNERPPAGRQDR